MATPGPAGNPGLYGVQGMAHSAAVRFRYTSHSSNYSITTQSPADCFVFYWNTNGELWHRHLRKRFTNQKSGASAVRHSSLPASILTAACVRYAEMRPATSSITKVWLTPENITDPDIALNPANFLYVCHNCHNKIENDGGNLYYFDENGQPQPADKANASGATPPPRQALAGLP